MDTTGAPEKAGKKTETSDLKNRLLPLIALSFLAVTAMMVIAYVGLDFWFNRHLETEAVFPLNLEIVKSTLESYRVQADNVQRLITLLISFSSLYALAVGVSSYLSTQGFMAQSQENAKKIDDLRKELERSYPFFHGMGERLEAMKTLLELRMPDSDERDDYLQELEKPDKQLELQLLEQSVLAWLEFLDFSGADSAGTAAGIYRNLGKYYATTYSRKKAELEEKKRNLTPDDIAREEAMLHLLSHRAECFLERSMKKDPHNFMVYNDLGFLMQDVLGEGSPVAKKWYEASLRYESKQQRAYYNLALMQFDLEKFKESEKLFTTALAQKNWQSHESIFRKADILYNRACSRSRQGGLDAANGASQNKCDDMLDAIADDLKEVCKVDDKKRFANMTTDTDVAAGGDLAWFASQRPQQVDSLLAQLKSYV